VLASAGFFILDMEESGIMRYSKFFGKTVKSISRQIQIPSHRLLVQGGFIRESVAGRYFFLPLGMRVNNKISEIIRQEMDRAGALEMTAPILHPLELWQETNRDSSGNFGLMIVKDRRGAEFALGGTAEEMFVDVVRKFPLSYKDLPFNIYQFSQKFRDELRARGGLLRVREFTMKDAYSFDRDGAAFAETYQTMMEAYTRIFQRVGLKTDIVPADNGYIGGEYSHEFIVESDIGESRYLVGEDGGYCAHEDVAAFLRYEINPGEAEKPLEVIDQPLWVKTIDDMAQHYGLPRSRFLKNVVYKNIESGEIVVAVIRGDLEVNKTKLEHAVGAVEQLAEATAEDLRTIGTRPGYVPSWGLERARYIGDLSLTTVKNFTGGHKTDTTDTINVNYGRDFGCERLVDIALAKPDYYTEDGRHKLLEKYGIEVGNIFQLGYYYSTKMQGATFTDQDGTEKPYYMGCYGIGVGRTLQAIAEIHRDERGIIWPDSVAPFLVHLIDVGRAEESEQVYHRLLEAGVELLYDDRDNVSPGAKFADADLIGNPIRLVVSKRTGDKIEWKRRDNDQTELLSLEDVLERLAY
jgi:prolyl-tRNA synthetase